MNDICVFGLPKAGKTSIVKVIFQKMQVIQTYNLESTNRMETVPIQMGSVIKFNIYDFSGSYDLNDPSPPEIAAMENCGLMIFVLDGTVKPYTEAIQYLRQAIQQLKQRVQQCHYHVFIHKIDPEDQGFEDYKRNEIISGVRSAVNDELNVQGLKNIQIDYHITTIFDHCLFEQFSKVIQKIIPYSQSIQILLDQLNVACKIEKSYLFEIVSKLYIASDSSPIDMANFQLCSEMIDVFIDITCIYGSLEEQGQSTIRLSDRSILVYKSIEKLTALICVIKADNYDRPFLVDQNMDIFKQGMLNVYIIGLQSLFKIK